MKKILALSIAMAMVSSAMAADFAYIGDKGVVAVADYSYSRAIGSPYSATHVGVTGLQFDMGKLGLVAVEAGDTQAVSNSRINFSTVEVTYANGHSFGALNINGAVVYSRAMGDVWLPFGKNSTSPTDTWVGIAEAAVVLSPKVALIADYEHSISWENPQNTTFNADTFLGSIELTLTKKINLLVGGGKTVASPNAWNFQTSLSYHF